MGLVDRIRGVSEGVIRTRRRHECRRGTLRACATGVLALALLAGCGPKTVGWEELNSKTVTLPDGKRVVCEVMQNQVDMMRGMMFRDSLAEDRGMLFIHPAAGKYPYWMYQVRIPLDIIWLDANGKVVEIVANAQPCNKTPSTECPNYGGHADALYVLELAGGNAARHGVQADTRLAIQ